MSGRAIEEAVFALGHDASVEIADTPALLREAFQLRYQVYCVERGFLAGGGGIERDQYDRHALHALVRWRQTGAVVGTVRLVLPCSVDGHDYPIQQLCKPALLGPFPRGTTGEVSRFALAKQMRGFSCNSSPLLRLALIQAAVRLSAEAGHSHWLAVMEPTLLRLLRSTGIHFEPLGPLVEYHGLRQPAVAALGPTLARLKGEQPIVWSYVTQNGRWSPGWQATCSRVISHHEAAAA